MNQCRWSASTLLLCLCASGLGLSCIRGPDGPAPIAEQIDPIHYGDSANWARLPEAGAPRRTVDVFYVYPTVVADLENPLMSWRDEEIRRKTVRIARQQTGMFEDFANIYAPFVRQLEFHRVMEAISREPPAYEAMRVGVDDVRAAFRHYLEQWNRGRPYVLLGHSQGAMDLFLMMKEDFGNPSVSSNLVAAYLIGMALHPDDLAGCPHLRLAQGSNDVGVIASYNSEAPGAARSPFSGPGTYGINPLNWRTDGEPASRSLNLGAVFFDEAGRIASEIAGFCGASNDIGRGALIVDLAVPGTYDVPTLLGEGVLHMNDLYFFYRNLGENARVRAAAKR